MILGELEYLLAFIDTKRIGGDTVADLAKDLQASAPVILLFLVLIFLPEDRVAHALVAPVPRARSRRCGRWRWRWSPTSRSRFVIVQSGWVSVSTIDELGKGIALGIVMLSLVLLTGYAGQISLAQLAFAGIAAATVWKLGPVVGLVGGVVIAAAVGALVALPALQDARPLPGPRHDGLRARSSR